MAKVIDRKTNPSGVAYALVQDGGTFGVYRRGGNYSRHAKGGIAFTWRYVEKGITREVAQTLFDRLTK